MMAECNEVKFKTILIISMKAAMYANSEETLH